MPDPENAQPRPDESLYRSSGPAAPAYRVTRRHYEPSLTPPEDEPRADDTFHWLYRPAAVTDRPSTSEPAPPVTAAEDSSPTVGPAPPAAGPAPTAVLDVGTLAPSTTRGEAAPRSWSRVVLLVTLLVALVAGTGVALAVTLADLAGR